MMKLHEPAAGVLETTPRSLSATEGLHFEQRLRGTNEESKTSDKQALCHLANVSQKGRAL